MAKELTQEQELDWAYFSSINHEKLKLLQTALNSELLSKKAHESTQHADQIRALADAHTCILDAFRALEHALKIIDEAVPKQLPVQNDPPPW